MTIKVAQWATGGVGKAAIQDVLAHPELELVGAWVHSADKHGKDVGEIIGEAPIGVLATNDQQAIIHGDADCVVYSPLMPNEAEVVALLEAGKNVVTPVGWVYPEASTTGALLAACEKGNSTLHGTGIHPGGITERFPLMVSALSAGVTHVRSEEFSDIRTYGAPDVIRHIMGFGGTVEEAKAGIIVGLLSGGFKQSVHMIADEMGFHIDPELTTVHEVAVATEPVPSPIGDIQPGQVAGQRFSWQATVKGRVVITATVNWLMGEALDPPWEIGPEGERFEVEVTGDPSVKLTFKGLQPETIEEGLIRNPGVVSTANHCVSAIPYVVAAGPGIKTYLDLPLLAGRAAPGLAK